VQSFFSSKKSTENVSPESAHSLEDVGEGAATGLDDGTMGEAIGGKEKVGAVGKEMKLGLETGGTVTAAVAGLMLAALQ
jgi:hypothetical protein